MLKKYFNRVVGEQKENKKLLTSSLIKYIMNRCQTKEGTMKVKSCVKSVVNLSWLNDVSGLLVYSVIFLLLALVMMVSLDCPKEDDETIIAFLYGGMAWGVVSYYYAKKRGKSCIFYANQALVIFPASIFGAAMMGYKNTAFAPGVCMFLAGYFAMLWLVYMAKRHLFDEEATE